MCNGGFDIDIPFTPQRLFELAKMDGAIILDGDGETILQANVHLVPDPTLPTSETGMRHRTAERVSRQTERSSSRVSQRRAIVNLYLMGRRITPRRHRDVLVRKANQALQTLQNYRSALDEVSAGSRTLEFDDLVTLGDVAEASGRFEMVRRVCREVGRYIGQLGTEGRLVRMQADELTAGVDDSLPAASCATTPPRRRLAMRCCVMDRLRDLPLERLLETGRGRPRTRPDRPAQRAEQHLRPRGYRVLAADTDASRSGRQPHRRALRLAARPCSRRDAEDLVDDVDGVGARRARAIATGLARVRRHVAVDVAAAALRGRERPVASDSRALRLRGREGGEGVSGATRRRIGSRTT